MMTLGIDIARAIAARSSSDCSASECPQFGHVEIQRARHAEWRRDCGGIEVPHIAHACCISERSCIEQIATHDTFSSLMILRRVNPLRRIMLVIFVPVIAVGMFWWNGKLEMASREDVSAFVHESLAMATQGKSPGLTEPIATGFLARTVGSEGVHGATIDVVEGDLTGTGASHGATVRLRDGRAILLGIDASGGTIDKFRITVITEGK